MSSTQARRKRNKERRALKAQLREQGFKSQREARRRMRELGWVLQREHDPRKRLVFAALLEKIKGEYAWVPTGRMMGARAENQLWVSPRTLKAARVIQQLEKDEDERMRSRVFIADHKTTIFEQRYTSPPPSQSIPRFEFSNLELRLYSELMQKFRGRSP